MSEQQNTRGRKPKQSDAKAEAPAPGAGSVAPIAGDLPHVWILPTAPGEFLAVASEADVRALGEHLRETPPQVLAAHVDPGSESAAVARTWKSIEPRFVDRIQESIFDFAKRMMVSIAWLTVAFGAARIRGEFEDIGVALGVLGLGFLGYTVFRYGYGIVRWHNRRVDASHAFAQATLQSNKLAARLASALELRANLKPEERGKSPDDELLDTNAYRKLIADGTTTTRELIALGEAINGALKFQDATGNPRRISDVAKDANLSTETAIFYRDLSAAAAEISLTAGMPV